MAIDVESLFDRYPFVGTVQVWQPERGYGKIFHSGHGVMFFAHFRNRKGTTQAERAKRTDLSGKRCVFHVGYLPQRHEDRRPLAVSWVIEDDVKGGLAQYDQARTVAVQQWSAVRLAEVLRATWYRDIWRGHQKVRPLARDLLLIERVDALLKSPTNLHDYLLLLRAKAESPSFDESPAQRQHALLEGVERLDGDLSRLLEGILPSEVAKVAASMPAEAQSILTAELRRAFVAMSIAVDIESDGESIYQIGASWEGGEELLYDKRAAGADLRTALKRLTDLSKGRWLVGHNITAWDIPILRKHDPSLFLDNRAWDTLLCSWLFAPWRTTHALVTSEDAHQAHKDASAALDLFKGQISMVPDYRLLTLAGGGRASGTPLDDLLSALPDIAGRSYPEAPTYLKQCQTQEVKTGPVVIPEWRLPECAWVPRVTYRWPRGHADPLHIVLSPSRVAEYAKRHDESLETRAMAAVIEDAAAHNVEVLPCMIPHWLRARLRDLVKACASATPGASTRKVVKDFSDLGETDVKAMTAEASWQVCTFSSLRGLPADDREDFLPSDSVTLVGVEEGKLDLLEKVKELSPQEVETAFQGERLRPTNQKLLRVTAPVGLRKLVPEVGDRYTYWLEHDPVKSRSAEHRPWCLWRSDLHVSEAGVHPDQWPQAMAWPDWLDRDTGGNLARDFVWPSSGSRAAYWQDTLARFLSLGSLGSDGTVLVLLLAHEEELPSVISALCALHLTLEVRDRRPLRQLEALRKEGYCFAADTLNHADQWLGAAELLHSEVRLVIEAVPLAQWWMCLTDEEKSQSSSGHDILAQDEAHRGRREAAATSEEDEEENTSGDDDVLADDDTAPVQLKRGLVAETSFQDAVLISTKRFAGPWIKTLLRSNAATRIPIVIDPRLWSVAPLARDLFQRMEVEYTPLSGEQLQTFGQLRDDFGQLTRERPPEDYEAYRKFLQNHWGHPDFKESQRAAIQAIVPNDSDVLVRLPTGEGKSVLFQIPALLRGDKTKRLTLVITPLRALMADQTRTLWGMGFHESVDYLSADRDPWVLSEVYQGILDNRIKLLFVAP